MMEKHYEHNQDLHTLFVDFKQAFDSIDRYKLYRAMEDMKIPHKLTRLVKMTMKNTTARVKVTNTLGNSCDGLFYHLVHFSPALWSPEDRSERHNFHETHSNICIC
jgi:hypothetical protein